jgi:transposase-like protein
MTHGMVPHRQVGVGTMTCDLTNPIFTDEMAAVAHMEADRWPNGEVYCPLCGVDYVTKMGGRTQAGMFMCNGCRGKFTVRTGTVFERSHIPLHKWLLATHLMASSKKGVSAHQLHRMLGITYKSAWFMAHRIREAMAPAVPSPIGGEGKFVEVDESRIGGKAKNKAYGPPPKKQIVMSPCGTRRPSALVPRRQRDGGNATADHRQDCLAQVRPDDG